MKNIKVFDEFSNEKKELFEKYMQLLLEWNEKINLTAITERNDIILKHFIDSSAVLQYIEDNSKIIDIGTGAGFPGIPLKILNSSLDITLMDSLNKRINFLNEVITELKLQKIEAIHARAEELGRNVKYREKYDICVSRAVANLSTLLEYMMPFIKVGGKCICMKGPNVQNELKCAENAIKELGGEIKSINNFILPNSDIERNIIIIRKKSKINFKYPRKPGTPGKEPL